MTKLGAHNTQDNSFSRGKEASVFSKKKKSFHTRYRDVSITVMYIYILNPRAIKKKERKKMTILAATKKEKHILRNGRII